MPIKGRLNNSFGICGERCHSPKRPLSSPRRLAEILLAEIMIAPTRPHGDSLLASLFSASKSFCQHSLAAPIDRPSGHLPGGHRELNQCGGSRPPIELPKLFLHRSLSYGGPFFSSPRSPRLCAITVNQPLFARRRRARSDGWRQAPIFIRPDAAVRNRTEYVNSIR